MPDSSFFSFSSYHILLALVGAIIIGAFWVPRLVSRREPAAAPLMIAFGVIAALLFPFLPLPPDPRDLPKIWEVVSEITVIIALFGTGMRVDKPGPFKKWRATVRLLLTAMPLTMLAVFLLGVFVGGLTLASAVLLAAVLAPTDPVLAADVQIAPPNEGGEYPVRFALTTEATLNDGLAFPFVYLALIITARGFNIQEWGL